MLLARFRSSAAFSTAIRSFSTLEPPPPRPALSEQYIHSKLTNALSPSELLVQDVSGGCGTFYAITIASDSLKGMPLLKQHRKIKDVLKDDMAGLHGIQLKVL